MINRIVPMAFPFVNYFRRRERFRMLNLRRLPHYCSIPCLIEGSRLLLFLAARQEDRVVGAQTAPANGNPSIHESSLKLPMTILPAADFGTAQDCCVGVPTKTLASAAWTK
jgi:hypothetical protein